MAAGDSYARTTPRSRVEVEGEPLFLRNLPDWCAYSPSEGPLDVTCPYGDPGDRLWVRESFGYVPGGVMYADTLYPESVARWRSPVQMPRKAARLLLEVTGVRVERLQAISEADAIAEGIAQNPVQPGTWIDYPEGTSAAGWRDPRHSYRSLWKAYHSRSGCAWADNPWVWVLSFGVWSDGKD